MIYTKEQTGSWIHTSSIPEHHDDFCVCVCFVHHASKETIPIQRNDFCRLPGSVGVRRKSAVGETHCSHSTWRGAVGTLLLRCGCSREVEMVQPADPVRFSKVKRTVWY